VELLETAATLYNIRIPNYSEDRNIRWLVEETGGEVLDVLDPASLKAALEKAMVRLRMQYTLGSSWWLIENSPGEMDYQRIVKMGIPFSTKIPLKVKTRFSESLSTM
jgi:hypothetical protein